MDLYWVSYKGDNKKFWNHEYNKHGHCFTQRFKEKNEQKYFDTVLALFRSHAFDQLMIHAVGDLHIQEHDYVEFTYESLRKALSKARDDLFFSLRCKWKNEKQYLVELHFYFDIELNPFEHERNSNCDKKKAIFVTFE